MRRTSNTRRLQIESLEKREMMAGNVSAYFQGNNLYLQGDNAANGVEIRQTSPGVLSITGTVMGGNFTTINGSGRCTASGVTGDVNIFLNGGNDHLDVGTGDQRVISVANNLNINMGAGSDDCNIRDVKVTRDLIVNTDTGVDKTYVSNANVGNNLLVGEAGPVYSGDYDAVTLNNCTVKNTIGFYFHQGNDSAEIVASVADSIYADMGDGNDFFKMNFSKARGFAVYGGNGYDTFYVPDYNGTRYNGSGFDVVKRG